MFRTTFILIFLSSVYLSAQIPDKPYNYSSQENLVIINKTPDDNLASNSVRKIIKTHDGYIFIATYDGLSIYDGREFINLNSENTKNLRSNTIYNFCYSTTDSIIWLATQKGVALYKNFKVFTPESLNLLNEFNVQKIICDQDGKTWIGTSSNGLYYYENNKLTKVESLPGIEKNIISVLYNDPKGKIWVGTAKGNLYYFENGKAHTVPFPKIANGVFAALCDSEGNYYFGTRNGIYTLKNNSISLLNPDINFVNDIQEDQNGRIWFATNSGLFYFNRKLNQFTDFLKKNKLDKQIILSVYFDDNGIVWISTYRKGLIQIKTSAFFNFPFNLSNF